MKVIAKMQSEGQNPIDMVWAKHADDLGVVLSVTQLLQHAKDQAPFSPEVISITIEL